MHSDELRTAVTKIVKLINDSGVRQSVDQYRMSKGEQRTTAAARLGHTGATLVEQIDGFSPAESKVMKCLHLNSLGSTDYWQQLVSPGIDAKAQHAEVVRLASRVMFASGNLPAIISLLESVPAVVVPAVSENARAQTPAPNPLLLPLEVGEGALFIRLTDAGERASDPDRIARAIDGVDMLYSACASIARKPAIDLRLDNVSAKENRDRDFRFTGEKDSVSAVFAVIDSIPAALADIDPEQEIDLDAVVRSLPIFQDLSTLASLGTFSGKDLKDISETMHQGALLTLESGVILIDEEMIAQSAGAETQQLDDQAIADSAVPVLSTENNATSVNATPSAAESDEHYNRYLREREAMMARSQTAPDTGAINGHSGTGLSGGVFGKAESGTDDQTRKDAVDELLKTLGQSRTS